MPGPSTAGGKASDCIGCGQCEGGLPPAPAGDRVAAQVRRNPRVTGSGSVLWSAPFLMRILHEIGLDAQLFAKSFSFLDSCAILAAGERRRAGKMRRRVFPALSLFGTGRMRTCLIFWKRKKPSAPPCCGRSKHFGRRTPLRRGCAPASRRRAIITMAGKSGSRPSRPCSAAKTCF